jgi:hypothetical protein
MQSEILCATLGTERPDSEPRYKTVIPSAAQDFLFDFSRRHTTKCVDFF